MTFLIDGYNLMHAVGMASHHMPSKAFERGRERFLDWLATSAAGRAGKLRVIFDAQLAPMPSSEYPHKGIRVCFAYGQTADDRIEEILAGERRPDLITVVSNDNQVREAARRRKCAVFTCEEFTDWLIEKPADQNRTSPDPDKPAPDATPDEMAAWLAAFSTPRKPRHG